MTTTDTPTDTTTDNAVPEPVAFTEEQVLDALNEAADDILEAVEARDEGLRDGINLMVNATIAYLRGTASDLDDVAEASYGENLDTILGWIGAAA
ncbi:hypothetical protein [Virgisporangium aurantiacum]|uniref:Uncharacterized protein n=1 Tax=Virgisporangium aurantiacum TaxID=175570 RepID=A0A8J3ZFW2_9ACTN|nr:hypothetical protein [Virgisporangium aurantiacum]GIJ62043.1 hypothetical protein Vau01_095590 [Virgisporangium aurantiacum]